MARRNGYTDHTEPMAKLRKALADAPRLDKEMVIDAGKLSTHSRIELTEIDRLEAPLREAHAFRVDTFQAFVGWLRAQPSHPLYSTAVAYNEAVYKMQQRG